MQNNKTYTNLWKGIKVDCSGPIMSEYLFDSLRYQVVYGITSDYAEFCAKNKLNPVDELVKVLYDTSK